MNTTEYKECGDGLAYLKEIDGTYDHYIVQAEDYNWDREKFKIISISPSFKLDGNINEISFDKNAEITGIPSNFIFCCNDKFTLPKTTKRVVGKKFYQPKSPIVVIEEKNKFVSITGKRNITNHYPLELMNQEYHHQNIFVKETIQLIGIRAFYQNKMLKSVVFPPSVVEICDYSFGHCYNLTQIAFKGKSNLKKIGNIAFSQTAIRQVFFPPSLEEIGDGAFTECKNIKSVFFTDDSNLRIIKDYAFFLSSIESIEFPKSLRIIGKAAFCTCVRLEKVSYRGSTRPTISGSYVFSNCPFNE